MKRLMRYVVGLAALLLTWAMLPTTASAAQLSPPALLTPGIDAVIDQPMFTWSAVEGAASYELEVALDAQFVTLTDPPIPANPEQVVNPIRVYGTTYVPIRSYQAKTLYWHVRTIGADGVRGAWGETRSFTRRWTNMAEPAGQDVSGVPASRVENVRLRDPGSSAINNFAISWDPVPGAAYYQVQISTEDSFQNNDAAVRTDCWTPHTTLAPAFSDIYGRRSPVQCQINTAIRPWQESAWTLEGSFIRIAGDGVSEGDLVTVRYPPDTTEFPNLTVRSVDVETGTFTVDSVGMPKGTSSGPVDWLKVALNLEVGGTYYLRVRAIDYSPSYDYPFTAPPTQVLGMWSDHRREPADPQPRPFAVSITSPIGGGPGDKPATPAVNGVSGSDIPLLTWTPVPSAAAYRVSLALDRDFTDIVGVYETRSASMMPLETLDDNGPNRRYYWYALPCGVTKDKVRCSIADREAINNDAYVGTFAKQSVPVKNLAAQPLDMGTQMLLRWSDALAPAHPETPGGVSKYQVQITGGDDWASALSVITDNLAYATTLTTPLTAGTYRWRVRPFDGDGIALAWSDVSQFDIVGSTHPTSNPSPSVSVSPTDPARQTSPPPPNPTPSLTYDRDPAGGDGQANAAPGKPGKPKVIRVSKRALKVRWRASQAYSDPVSAYQVMWSTNGQRFTEVARTSARSARLRAKRGQKYWFYVVAISAAGRSAQSATTLFTMPKR